MRDVLITKPSIIDQIMHIDISVQLDNKPVFQQVKPPPIPKIQSMMSLIPDAPIVTNSTF